MNTPTYSILADIKDAVDGYQARANYACSGTLPITFTGQSNIGNFGASNGPITCPPITLRWDSPHSGAIKKIQFPPTTGTEEEYSAVLRELVNDCAPATFGRSGKDVLDESYRKAGKLDNTQFSVDFTPYDYGIISAITQTILQGFRLPKLPLDNSSPEHVGVVAELYKLNVYSAPSGMFKAHVDTPRGLTQFGSLVVCLPCPHQGGGLRVTHKGHEITYDWSNTDATTCSWAAFYSDVEHEVNPVTSGHRITLTYNLYISEHIGGILHPFFPTVDPALYPLYSQAQKALERQDFMPSGGILGFNCNHKYAHTNGTASHRMPFALKGIDVALFSVFSDLGLEVLIRPMVILEQESDDEELDDLESDDEEYDEEVIEQKRREHIEGPRIGQFIGITGYNETHESKKREILEELWPHQKFLPSEITWLNAPPPNSEEKNYAYLAHGNQAELHWFYTSVVILITVPEFLNRVPRDRVSSNTNMRNVERNLKRVEEKDEFESYDLPVEIDSSSEDGSEIESAGLGGIVGMSWE